MVIHDKSGGCAMAHDPERPTDTQHADAQDTPPILTGWWVVPATLAGGAVWVVILSCVFF
ncbi:hypothetical protein [Roseivivax sediminis]|uniref:Uncharacterized protein n=1 Tax=Roseivivax sediminis TaxID=936889 RepID=A0A1I2CG77_9RHOB|nr:hypothetical protein [Roseivivax sediminis]SFE67254.1 hypothetical protein SAMN04515678_113101 [Roseivivax sediminis]